MKFSLAVKDFEKSKKLLGKLYDPDSPFCIYEPGIAIPEKKLLIVLSKHPLDIPNVVLYITSIEELLYEPSVAVEFPEEDFETKEEEKEQPIKKVRNKIEIDPGDDDNFLRIEKKKVSVSKKEKPKFTPKEEEQKAKCKPAVREEKQKLVQKKQSVISVLSKETAFTVAVSIHKFNPALKIDIVDKELAETYGQIDLNLRAVVNSDGADIIIKVSKDGDRELEKYKGREYSNWKEIARRALSCTR